MKQSSAHALDISSGARRFFRAMWAFLLSLALSAALAEAQRGPGFGRGGWGGYIQRPDRDIFPGDTFTFCTVDYRSVRSEALGFGWNTDYPDAGRNFMARLAELTTIHINRYEDGRPKQAVVRLTDPELFNYPHIFMSDVGTADFSKEEAELLREYLLRGGFLHVDDFWGTRAWNNWQYEIEKVLPPGQFPIKDIPLDHAIFKIVFDVKEVPQVPSIQWWNGGRNSSSERGADSAVPHLRGIFDETGRLMVLMSHNTDIADGWEKERADKAYFEEFSVKKSYPLGINIVVYSMTH